MKLVELMNNSQCKIRHAKKSYARHLNSRSRGSVPAVSLVTVLFCSVSNDESSLLNSARVVRPIYNQARHQGRLHILSRIFVSGPLQVLVWYVLVQPIGT